MKDNFDIHEWRLKQAMMNEAVPFNKQKADLNNDNKLSDYEKARGMAIAKNMNEDDWMQADDEASMAHSQLRNIKRLSAGLCDMIEDEEQLDAWVQAKLTKAEDYLQSVYGYLYGEDVQNQQTDEPNIILGSLNEINPSELQIGKSYKYTGTVPGGADSVILTFKGIKKYKDGKDHYYFINNQGTGALLSYDSIINNLTSID